jgi:serine/threonine protein kinase
MLSLGTVLNNRYRVDRMLEIGALEAQYVGWDLEANTPVTIKELMPQPDLENETLQALQATFEQDAAALAQLHHPGVAGVLGYFCAPTQGGSGDAPDLNAYLIQPALAGQSLAELLKQEGSVAEGRVIAWAIQTLDALSHIHNRGVRHRDINPDNILIMPDDRAVLTNFEILALWDPSDPRTWTAKRVMGTPEYAPPERWGMRHTKVDPRSDIYSLGATLYHALTGEQPLTAGERTSNPYRFLQVKALSPRVSDRTKNVILKAMELPQDRRFQSAAEMAEALRDDSGTVTPTKQAPLPAIFLPQPQHRQQAGLSPLAWLSSVLVILAAGLVGMQLSSTWGSDRSVQPMAVTAGARTTVQATPAVDGVTAAEIIAVTTPDPAAASEPQPISATGTPVATAAAAASPTTVFDTLAPTAPSDWERLVTDTFDDNSNQWLISEYEDDWGSASRQVTGGTYRWVINADQAVGRWCTPELDGEDGVVSDFYVSIDAQRLSGPDTAAYGLILRLTEGRYYLFSVRDDGYYQFSLWLGHAWQPVIDWTQTTLLVSGETNRLTVIAEEDRFEFYINDEFADKAEDDQLPEGEIGLSISTAATDGDAVFIFDNYELWRP